MWLVFSGQVVMLNDSFDFLIKMLIMYIPILLLLCLALALKGKQFWTTKGLKKMDMFLTSPLTFASIIVHYDDTVFFLNSSCSCHKTIFPFLFFKV